MKVVLALGGNALLPPKTSAEFKDEVEAVKKTASIIAEISKKHEVILTHGNGPQVGLIFAQQLKSNSGKPLDVCGAESQGQIGYLLQQALNNEFERRSMKKKAVTVLTQVEVMENDPDFKDPSKPVGPFFSWFHVLFSSSKDVKHIPKKGYRKVVPSPAPVKIIEIEEIESLIKKGFVVICCGGGGVPVIRKGKKFQGVEAVIDKDRTASLLARSLKADLLAILTDVDAVYLNFNKSNEKKLSQVSQKNLKDYLKNGHFGSGSMRPKVEAAIDFSSKSKKDAVIGSLSNLSEVILKKNCTVVTP